MTVHRMRRELFPGVFLTCLQTEKFRTGHLSVHLIAQLTAGTASSNALLPSVLRRGTVSAPDLAALSARLDDLYGARIEPSVRKLGELQAVGFTAEFVDVPGRDLLGSVARLVGELLLAPNTRGGLLLPGYVESEREKLLEDIRARVNDRAEYAQARLVELMCPGEDYAVDALGSEETARSIGYVALTRHYRTLLAQSPVEVFYCGAAAPEEVAAVMTDALSALPRGELDMDIGTDIRLNTVDEAPRVFTETMEVGQGKLAIGYRIGAAMDEPDMAALRVMDALFGGGWPCKLSANVREKLSLCYYAYSELDVMKGVLTVASGIDPADYDAALAEIGRQLQAVKDGDFTDGELQTARRAVSSRMLELTDSPAALEKFWLAQNLLGLDYGPEELAALAEVVTAEDVVKAAAGVACDAVYFLTGEEQDAED